MSSSFAALLLAVFPLGLITAALKDVTSFTIPNWIPGGLVLCFFPAAMVAHLPLPEIGAFALTGLIALAAGVGMFALGWCGGGDAKLLAAAALWLGPKAALPFVLATALAGGALGLGLILARKGLVGAAASAGPAWLSRLFAQDGDLPYGIAIAVGALLAFPSSALLAAGAG